MLRHGGHMRLNWHRALLLLLVFVLTLLFIYHMGTREEELTKGVFFEDFGEGSKSVTETLSDDSISAENSKEMDKEGESLDQIMEQAQVTTESTPSVSENQLTESSTQQQQQSPPPQEELQEVNKKEEPNEQIEAQGNQDANNPERGEKEIAETADQLSKPIKESATASIPKVLHQSAPSDRLPSAYQALIESCLNQNANWQYYMWRDKDRKEFIRIRFPQHADWFDDLTRQQQDQLFRVFVLKVYGGIFMDIDVECLKPFEPAIANLSLLVAEERPELTRIVKNLNNSADFSVLGGIPEHQLFSDFLESLASLSNVPVDLSALLTALFEKTSKTGMNCNLLDYHYFGSALDGSFPWQEECEEVLNDLQQTPTGYQPEHELYNKQQGCIQLRNKDWKLVDINDDSFAVRRFLNISPTDDSNVFNASEIFSNRVTHY